MWPLIDRHVIKAGLCQVCGGCFTACPVAAIDLQEHSAFVLSHCIECLACDKVCPVLDSFLGPETEGVEGIWATKSCMRGQDGATVSAIIGRLFELGYIDCAIGVKRDEGWNPSPVIIEDKDEVPSISFSKYTYVPTLVSRLREAVDQGFERIALTGVSCQSHSWALFRESFERYSRKIGAIIGVFCMETFDRVKFLEEYLASKEVSTKNLKKVDITHGRLVLYTDSEKKSEKIKNLGYLVRNGCHSCVDFSSYFADISVGYVGSPDGWNTLVIRTERGWQIWNMVKDIFALDEAAVEEVGKLSEYKRKMRFEEYKITLPDLEKIFEDIVEGK